MRCRPSVLAVVCAALLAVSQLAPRLAASGSLASPDQFLGFTVGTDNTLARWDRIVEYMKLVATGSDRARYRELGQTTNGHPLIVLEISAADTMAHLERYKQLQRKLYASERVLTAAERDEITREGKLVVLVTCSIHATEIGASQMALELAYRLATDESPLVRRILDNVILLLVPSLNPDGQIMVTDWFNRNVGTPFESGPIPFLYHSYTGHDNNRDMYMFTQKESRLVAQLAWHEWFPSVWLDEHQMGMSGPRIFVMPGTDPINPNVHPLIYRWSGILGQAQAAALEAAGKGGIISNTTYTNFWEGAMAWSGWWHNQIGLLTEVASVRIAAPVDQQRTSLSDRGRGSQTRPGARGLRAPGAGDSLPPPTDVTPRTMYPRPWLGGHWTLRDIVDYELIATMGLLETAAAARETIIRQIGEVNRLTIEEGRQGNPSAILVPTDQFDPREALHLVDTLRIGGLEVYRADELFEADGRPYAMGTFVVPMAQVFARYAKDLLERQVYPEVRRTLETTPEPPYDVTAWSLGLLVGVDTVFAKNPLPAGVKLTPAAGLAPPAGTVSGAGPRFAFAYRGADTARALNQLLSKGARAVFDGPSHIVVSDIPRKQIEAVAAEFGLVVGAGEDSSVMAHSVPFRAPKIALYQPYTGGNADEGWTRWVLEQYGFASTAIHNAEVRAGGLRERFDAVVLADQDPRDIVNGFDGANIRPEYRGGIGDKGVESLKQFVASGGTLIALGAACDLAIEQFPIAVQNLKRGLTRDQHFGPGTILRVQVDGNHPIGFGVPPATHGFYTNGPFFAVGEGASAGHASIVARFPDTRVLASGWLRGEELMAGRAAVVSIEMNPGRLVLFGLRPQHRGQTHATFPMLFNALYLAGSEGPIASLTQ